jgi:hypothetical protein
LYLHEWPSDAQFVSAAIVNRRQGLGLALRLSPAQLPYMAQWKVLRQSEYVLGFEPGNCFPLGRSANSERGALEILPAQQTKRVELELHFMDTEEELDAY